MPRLSLADYNKWLAKEDASKPAKKGGNRSKSHTALVKMCLALLKLNGILAWNNPSTGIYRTRKDGGSAWVPSGERGRGDIGIVLPGGRYCEIECKTGKGKQSKYQLERERELISNGALYFVVRNVNELKDWLLAPDARKMRADG